MGYRADHIIGMWLNREKVSQCSCAAPLYLQDRKTSVWSKVLTALVSQTWSHSQMNDYKMHFEMLLNSESWTLDQIG